MTRLKHAPSHGVRGDSTVETIPATAERPTALIRGMESILVVEDDEMVRATIGEFLRLDGYRVLEAGDGEQAWDRFRRRPRPFDLVVADVVMPGWSGLTLAEELLESDPRVKVLLISGYTAEHDVRACVRSPRVAFLGKPFSRSRLSNRIRDVLDGRVPPIEG